jgi:hypothetical protein
MRKYLINKTVKEVVHLVILLAMKKFTLQDMMPCLKKHVGIDVLVNISSFAIDV